MMKQLRKMDRKIGAVSQDRFNTIMYSIVGVTLVVLVIAGFKPALHQMFYQNYDLPAKQAQEIQAHQVPQQQYEFYIPSIQTN
jgi:hypothetical protein